jgi:sugar/nucleoside kinase (ribokinase family)
MAKILGIGNALLDILIPATDEMLSQFKLPKGSMQLVDKQTRNSILQATEGIERKFVSGGSAANTIHGLACLGIETGFIGKIGKDEYGNHFEADLKKAGITPMLQYGQAPNGTAIAFVTPDSERTFATYLGAAIEQTPEDLDEFDFSGFDILYIEGYLLQNHSLVEKAMKTAHEKNLKIALDCASYNVVEENRDFLLSVIKNYVDIVFANEEEAKALTGQDPETALQQVAKMCEVVVVKTGSKGSLAAKEGKTYKTGVFPVEKLIDTTGAGDLYAAGFLWAYLSKFPVEKCLQAGSITAANVITEFGARIAAGKWPDIIKELNKIS